MMNHNHRKSPGRLPMRLLAVAIIVLLGATRVAAQDGKPGATAAIGDLHLARGEYPEALEQYNQAVAKEDDLHARCQLGRMYFAGLGVEKDAAAAFAHFKYAAERGAPTAQTMLGVMCQDGIGTLRDYQQAADWYAKAALQNNDMAAYNLALMYANGRGIGKDVEKYVQYLRQAAKLGNARALYDLGNEYRSGRRIPRNLPEAAASYSEAAKQGNLLAQIALGLAYCTGEGVERDLRKAKACIKAAYDASADDPPMQGRCKQVWNTYELYKY